MKHTAIYAGTFDPITNGHVDVVRRAAQLFDKLIIAVATSQRKDTLLSLADRVQLAQTVFTEITTVEVHELHGLLVDFAKQHQARILLRGLRSGTDFDYEFQLAGMNQAMAADIETVYLPAANDVRFISATIVREIQRVGGDITPFVPPAVGAHLRGKS